MQPASHVLVRPALMLTAASGPNLLCAQSREIQYAAIHDLSAGNRIQLWLLTIRGQDCCLDFHVVAIQSISRSDAPVSIPDWRFALHILRRLGLHSKCLLARRSQNSSETTRRALRSDQHDLQHLAKRTYAPPKTKWRGVRRRVGPRSNLQRHMPKQGT